MHDDDLHFREYYNLKDFDIIDESEEIATHLISELNSSAKPSVFQRIEYPDGRQFEGFYRNGLRNGLGKLRL